MANGPATAALLNDLGASGSSLGVQWSDGVVQTVQNGIGKTAASLLRTASASDPSRLLTDKMASAIGLAAAGAGVAAGLQGARRGQVAQQMMQAQAMQAMMGARIGQMVQAAQSRRMAAQAALRKPEGGGSYAAALLAGGAAAAGLSSAAALSRILPQIVTQDLLEAATRQIAEGLSAQAASQQLKSTLNNIARSASRGGLLNTVSGGSGTPGSTAGLLNRLRSSEGAGIVTPEPTQGRVAAVPKQPQADGVTEAGVVVPGSSTGSEEAATAGAVAQGPGTFATQTPSGAVESPGATVQDGEVVDGAGPEDELGQDGVQGGNAEEDGVEEGADTEQADGEDIEEPDAPLEDEGGATPEQEDPQVGGEDEDSSDDENEGSPAEDGSDDDPGNRAGELNRNKGGSKGGASGSNGAKGAGASGGGDAAGGAGGGGKGGGAAAAASGVIEGAKRLDPVYALTKTLMQLSVKYIFAIPTPAALAAYLYMHIHVAGLLLSMISPWKFSELSTDEQIIVMLVFIVDVVIIVPVVGLIFITLMNVAPLLDGALTWDDVVAVWRLSNAFNPLRPLFDIIAASLSS